MFSVGKNELDIYCLLRLSGREYTTKINRMNKQKEVTWNQEFVIPVQLPILSNTLTLEFWDKNKFPIEDICVGSLPYKISNIMRGYYVLPNWQNIYGSPVNNEKDITKEMNKDPECASRWKGRVLMQMVYEETFEPQWAVSNITQTTPLQLSDPHGKPNF